MIRRCIYTEDITRCRDCIHCEGGYMSGMYCMYGEPRQISNINGKLFEPLVDGFPPWCPLEVI